MQKIKNQVEATLAFSEMEVLNRAMNLAQATLLGNTNRINEEGDHIQAVTAEDIYRVANEVLIPENCSTMYYRSQTE